MDTNKNGIPSFQNIVSTFTPTIFPWSFYCDFTKIIRNTFSIKIQLNILNSLIGEDDIETKFLRIIELYPEVRRALLVLLAVRNSLEMVFDEEIKEIIQIGYLFDSTHELNKEGKNRMLDFFRNSGLKKILEDKNISNLNDYVFGIETGLDSNARKNRSGTIMEKIVGNFLEKFCVKNSYQWKEQATAIWIKKNWGIEIENDKSARRFDFAIYTGSRVYLFETNFYGGGGSKLKAVAGEFSGLYQYLQKQDIDLIWITDGLGWKSALKPLEEAYNATNGNIFNIEMLRNDILQTRIK